MSKPSGSVSFWLSVALFALKVYQWFKGGATATKKRLFRRKRR